MLLSLDECLSAECADAVGAEVSVVMDEGGPVLRVRVSRDADQCAVALRAPEGKWDLSAYTFISVEVKNLSDDALGLVCYVTDTAGRRPRDYGIDVAPGETYPVHLNIGPHASAWTRAAFPRMFCNPLGFPEGKGGWAHPNVDPAAIASIHLCLRKPGSGHVFEVSNVRARGERFGTSEELVRDDERFYPLIDEFGQYMHKEWPGKVHSAADLAKRREEEEEDLARHRGPADWNQYDGWSKGPQLEATGFFRTEKYEGKWWLVDPDGRLFWSNGMDCVGVHGETPTQGRERFFRAVPGEGGFVASNLGRKFDEDWRARFAEETHRRLRSWGANTIGDWSDPEVYLQRKTPYTVAIHYGCPVLQGKRDAVEQGPWVKGVPDPFDPGFERSLRERLEEEVGKSAGDPWCIGYFIDNELHWSAAPSVTLESPAGQPAKRVLTEGLRAKHVTIERLNTSWGTSFGSWDAFLADRDGIQPGTPCWEESLEDLNEFAMRHHEEYFRICKKVVEAVAPRNLYLGCRFNTAGGEGIAERAAAKHCDILSYNQYKHRVAGFRLPEGIDRPVVIGEFHFGALDRGMFWNASVQVASQEERGEAYKAYVRSALQNAVIVGVHWFAYGDEATTGRGDGENGQIGFVDVCDTPYPEMVGACRDVGYDLYRSRLGKP